jgi:hypothetical protein
MKIVVYLVILGIFVWFLNGFSAMLGLTDNQAQSYSSKVSSYILPFASTDQRAYVDNALSQVLPSPQSVQAQIDNQVPVITQKLIDAKTTLGNEAAKLNPNYKP